MSAFQDHAFMRLRQLACDDIQDKMPSFDVQPTNSSLPTDEQVAAWAHHTYKNTLLTTLPRELMLAIFTHTTILIRDDILNRRINVSGCHITIAQALRCQESMTYCDWCGKLCLFTYTHHCEHCVLAICGCTMPIDGEYLCRQHAPVTTQSIDQAVAAALAPTLAPATATAAPAQADSVTCECGAVVKKASLTAHKKTAKHRQSVNIV